MSYKLRIERDEDPMSPRDLDNVGTIVASHRRYSLGDKGDPAIDLSDFDSWEAVEQHLREQCGAVAVLPVHLYDHSGIALSTVPFCCPWDSGRVGVIYATAESVASILGTDVTEDTVLKALCAEVAEYHQYVSGDVWCFVIEDRFGNVVDSCCGFYSEEDATNEGKAALGYLVDNEPKPCAQPSPACS